MNLKINEVFRSIQGEGRYQGTKVLFARLSGCNRKCNFCDTKYHNAVNMNISAKNFIKKFQFYQDDEIVVFTGGEPLLQINEIRELFSDSYGSTFHLETNGDLIKDIGWFDHYIDSTFEYVCISPKDVKTAKRVNKILKQYEDTPQYNRNVAWDIKVVTDLETVGVDMLKYATMLMPLTTRNQKKDQEIRRKVWEKCIQLNLFYSARLHVEVFGNERGV